ncbi:MAG TPA: DUF885 domain-containing protein [Allosphingosinicella sp.]
MNAGALNRRELLAAGALLIAAPAAAAAPESESDRLAHFFETVFRRDVARSGALQAQLGLREGFTRWPDIGQAHALETAALKRQDLAALRGFDRKRLTPEADLSRRLFDYDAEDQLIAIGWRTNHYTICQMRGPQRWIPQTLINNHPIAARADAEAYIVRLHRVRPHLEEVVEELDRQARAGVRPPAFSYPLVIGNCRHLIEGAPFDASGADSPILADFKAKIARLGLPDADREKLERDAVAGLDEGFGPGFRRLIGWLEASQRLMKRNDGVWSLPDGEAYYRAALRMETTLPASAAEIHRVGLDEVARLHGEIGALKSRLGFTGSLADFFAHARTSPDLYYPNTDAGRARYLDEMRARIAEVTARLGELTSHRPRADVEIRAVEPWLQASAGTAGYYGPSADGSRPGILYVNERDMHDLPVYEISALAYHEGVPGHHLQIAVAQELTGIPRFRKFADYDAYGEGWGLYAEQLPLEMGLYRDDWQKFGQLTMELMRAGRLVVDTGLHAMRWTREQAIAWLDANTADGHDDNVTSIQRYIVTPGQACAYGMGKLKMLELRALAQRRLGPRYSLRGYNDAVLGSGSLPMPILESVVRAWIDRQA